VPEFVYLCVDLNKIINTQHINFLYYLRLILNFRNYNDMLPRSVHRVLEQNCISDLELFHKRISSIIFVITQAYNGFIV
jgi:hypothetical protein